MKRFFQTLFLLALTPALWAANTVKTVSQVSTLVTVSDDVDYTITSTTPFTGDGRVDITNLEHAVVILSDIKPSLVIQNWLKYVKINGQAAVNNTNCQVKMYGHGAIILPYDKNFKPLTVFSEPNFQGSSCNDFGLGNTGGFMNTLTDEQLNNRIRSFRLKRGYMVTFSTRKGGRGYSRCFIADKADLEFAELPVVLDQTISSYRIFHWYNARKAGLASDTRAEATSALNASWCYDWGTGVNRLPDTECVPNHIYENWPSAEACGGVTHGSHMKTNNEPGNSADDHPQSVAEVLANWENLMRTGLRLCSETSHDGSMGHLKEFIDSIDARGWRCDVLDLHCYWQAGTFNNLTWYSDHYGNGRPIFISEWVWGASWNHNGFWGATSTPGECSEANQTILYNGTKPILDVLNANSRVERYAYWNSEAAGTHIYHDGKLTKLGQYYATMNDGMGYNPANEFIPRMPRQYNPSDLKAVFDKAAQQVTLQWHDANGEYNKSMTIQCKKAGTTAWNNVQVVEQQEDAADYTVAVAGNAGDKYRVRIVDVNNKERLTNEASAVADQVDFGDAMTVVTSEGNLTMYMGGNRLINGDFEMGLADWTTGTGEPLKAPYFQVVPEGGIDGGAYLQCYGHGSSTTDAQAIRRLMQLNEGDCYYVAAAGCHNNPKRSRISTTSYEAIETYVRVSLPDVDDWARQGATFRVSDDQLLMIQFRELEGKAQFDDVMVCRLFPTLDEAMADALVWEKQRAELFLATYADYPACLESLSALLATDADANSIEDCIQLSLAQIRSKRLADAQAAVRTVEEERIPLDGYQLVTDLIQSPLLASTTGWNTKTGTYTGGDQRLATQAGLTCWNAWWSLSAAGNDGKTMAISQEVSNLTHGLYALDCKATTQHLCETDQHAFLSIEGQQTVSPALPLGKLDLPSFSDPDKWCSLSTSYLYAPDRSSATIGFQGSKQGAVDGSWIAYGNPTNKGDNREGWWCATDFKFRFVPMLRRSTESNWTTVCSAYELNPDYCIDAEGHLANVTFYQVAGILTDGTALCLEEVSELVPGTPYIIHAADDQPVSYFEVGQPVTKAVTNANGLRGDLLPSGTPKYPKNALVLRDGVWQFIATAADQTPIVPYAAFIQKVGNLAGLESWSGVTMPVSGVDPSTITSLTITSHDATSAAEAPCFDLQGRRLGQQPASGLFLQGRRLVIR